MKFHRLRPDTWNAYAKAHENFNGLWIFQHVPKTAGSSITVALSSHAAPYTNISPNRTTPTSIRKQYRELSATTPLERDGKPMRSVSGHLWKADVDALLGRDPDARLFTFVRDPVQRVISDYRYSRTPAHAQWQEQIKAYPNLDSYIEDSPAVRNKTVFFLTGERDGDAAEVVPWIMARFDYIGLLEDMEMSHTILNRLLRMGEAQVEHRRSTEALPQNAETPTPAQLARIRKMNGLDLALFRRVKVAHVKLREANIFL
ncbi:sulfotransferase family 2 domain-containing protein [Paracoccus nototheniae]|uniref:Sulfotransferase family 2 domain-containing protein n=1 Tax=Paracoccus nototheniae TaxID=2489002 RepID=A0ABW4E305_9RHOB|nr:sulfotransferase family 2 domain-containing protein [Paracoccus nototheniae]